MFCRLNGCDCNRMETELSNFLLKSAKAHPDLLPRMKKLAAEIGELTEGSRELSDYEVLEERAKDTGLLRFITSTLETWEELPGLRQKDYRAYMMLIALSHDSRVVAFLLDYLTFAYIRDYRVEELLLFSDILYLLNARNTLLNGLYNFVCYFFREERRDVMKRRDRYITDKQFARAEGNMPHLGKRPFREEVGIKARGVYSVKELAHGCGMAYGTFRQKFAREFGVFPGSWINEQRIADIKYLLQSTSLTLAEIAKKTGFATPSSFDHYCVKHLHFPPGKLREFYR